MPQSTTTSQAPPTGGFRRLSVEIRLPPLDELARNWHRIEPILARACDRSRCYLPIDVLLLVTQREMMLWLVDIDGALAAVLVCRVQQYPRRRVLEVKFAAGTKMREWIKPVVEHFDRLARELGCDAVSTTGRRGWARAASGVEVDTVSVRELGK